ncbi:hypothetical protein AA471_13460 [Salmonella enterica subsp. enterica]|nr:hypothetical protein [Salmonella enterica subsp. enterica]ECI0979441.1 hypothetical protein [Salmonella enterica subsp. enterica serovar Newport]ECO0899436.1 hypothetical protein [Salmonella enterica subsp. enterica serovar Newport]EDQ2989048.1 hypothetical protein [Salmonella enterica subsp. enterica]
MSKAEQQTRIRKIMLHAINEAVNVGVIPLMFRHRRMTAEGYAKITVCDKPSIINWTDTGHDDFRVTVWWDYQPEKIPRLIKGRPENLKLLLPDVDRSHFSFIVGTCASFYFDYLHKAILSDKGKEFFAVYVRESTGSDIDKLKEVKPFGYSISELSRPLLKNDFTTSRRSVRKY